MADAQVQVRRVYKDPAEDDGARVLVDRIWPRADQGTGGARRVVQGDRAVNGAA